MRSPSAAAIAVVVAAIGNLPSQADAFAYTSPFFVVSGDTGASKQIVAKPNLPTREILNLTKDIVRKCTSDVYIIAQQPGIHASDFSPHSVTGTVGMPHMKRYLSKKTPGAGPLLIVPYGVPPHEHDGAAASEEELGTGDVGFAEEVVKEAEKACGAERREVVVGGEGGQGEIVMGGMGPKVFWVKFPRLVEPEEEEQMRKGVGPVGEKRREEVKETDSYLFSLISTLQSDQWTLVYTSTPIFTPKPGEFAPPPLKSPERTPEPQYTQPQAQPAHEEHVNTELKRRADKDKGDDDDHDNPPKFEPSKGSLFERYVFFGPGIFMGYVAAFFLALIVSVGVKALGSLKVSYGAFEKEMGPAAQKKQQ